LAVIFGASLALAAVALSVGWSSDHGLAVRDGEAWLVQTGLDAGFAVLAGGLVVGLLLGGALGWIGGSKVWTMLWAHEDERVAKQLAAVNERARRLEEERHAVEDRIDRARQQGIEIAYQRAWEREQELVSLQRQLRSAEDKVKKLEGKLKGAHGRARRKGKHTDATRTLEASAGSVRT
jgi:hypothetical protein